VARRCGGGALHDRGRCRWGVGQRKPQTTPAAGRRPLGVGTREWRKAKQTLEPDRAIRGTPGTGSYRIFLQGC
jgi:hypothetical protein